MYFLSFLRFTRKNNKVLPNKISVLRQASLDTFSERNIRPDTKNEIKWICNCRVRKVGKSVTFGANNVEYFHIYKNNNGKILKYTLSNYKEREINCVKSVMRQTYENFEYSLEALKNNNWDINDAITEINISR